MKILIVSDAWHPQINGVVRTFETVAEELRKTGHEVRIVGPAPSPLRSLSAPTYPEIKLEFFANRRLRRIYAVFEPDVVHIATEGPLGWAMRSLCLHNSIPFTTSYHTRFPEYLAARVPFFIAPMVKAIAYRRLRHFHAPSSAIMVPTQTIKDDLHKRHFKHLVLWSGGVDLSLFKPRTKNIPAYAALDRPVLLYVGRVSVEKNLRAFLDLKTVGSMVVIGDGPDFDRLKKQYSDTLFLGRIVNEALAAHFAAADLFVFPSKTDTFGLVLLEAAASGLRLAAYPVPGPLDVLSGPEVKSFSCLNNDLGVAVEMALSLKDDPTAPRRYAEGYSWEASTRTFISHLQPHTPLAMKRIRRFNLWLTLWWRDLRYLLTFT